MAKDKTGSGERSGPGAGLTKPSDADIKQVLELPIIKNLAGDFKSFFGIDLSTVLSAFDDEIHEIATKIGNDLGTRVKKDSWIRGWFLRRLSGVAINQLEKFAKTQGPVIQSLLIKLADFFDSLRQSFFGSKEAAEQAEKQHFEAHPELLKKLADLDADLAADGARLLKETLPTELNAVQEHLNRRARAWHQQKNLLINGPEIEQEQEELSVPFWEHLRNIACAVNVGTGKFCTELVPSVREFKATTERMKREQEAKRNPAKNKTAKRFSRLLFGFPK